MTLRLVAVLAAIGAGTSVWLWNWPRIDRSIGKAVDVLGKHWASR